MSRSNHKDFNTPAYLSDLEVQHDSLRRPFMLRCYHEVIQSLPSNLSVLDYGSGPTFFSTISVSAKASEIVLSDCAESNLKALRQWLDKDPDAYDWSSYFRYVVEELEEKGKDEVEKRQKLVRKKTKAVVLCDLTEDPPIESGYDKKYDVVFSCLCISAASRTAEDFHQGIVKLGKLVKPGGTLLIYEGEMTSKSELITYDFEGVTLQAFGATSELMIQSLKDAGFVDISLKRCAPNESYKEYHPNSCGLIFLQSKKL